MTESQPLLVERFAAAVGDVYKVYYRRHYLLTLIVTGYIQQMSSLIL